LEGANSYRKIFKATSLFGGVQIIQVLLNLVRGKVIAVLLGAAGVGLNSLFISSVSLINNISGLGLNFTAVRDIAKANESDDKERLSYIITVFKRWLFATSFIGFVAVIILSPVLSQHTFKSSSYIFSFVLLSFMVLFGSLSAGNAALLQGTRSLKKYAMHTLTGSLVGLVVSVPFYYFMGIKGIVPALIVSAFITYLFSIYYTLGIHVKTANIGIRETYTGGLDMVKLGVAMMLSISISSLVHYLINTFISSKGSLADLGFYQAGMAITSQSIGLVFTAMAVDYYPRLAAVCDDNAKVKEMVNQQGEITMLIATPALILLSVAAPLAIKILYSSEFLPVTGFLRTIAFGMLFKAASYSIGAISFSKGDKKVFFLLEGIYMNASILLFSIIGYKIGGLSGLSVAYLIMHFVYFVLINIVTGRLYKFSLDRALARILIISLILMSGAYISLRTLPGIYAYITAGTIVLISFIFSYIEIDKLVGVKEIVNKILRRK